MKYRLRVLIALTTFAVGRAVVPTAPAGVGGGVSVPPPWCAVLSEPTQYGAGDGVGSHTIYVGGSAHQVHARWDSFRVVTHKDGEVELRFEGKR